MDKLVEIMAWKRQEVGHRVRPIRDSEYERLARLKRTGKGFGASLRRAGGVAVIAEIKRRSPSAGAIAPEVEASEQARLYYNAGADALSVLTDEKFFGGSIRDLWEVNDLLQQRPDTPPTLRKDFFVHPIQVVEAAEAGARAVLLIVRALEDPEMRQLREAADRLGLDSLYEVHDRRDLERALRHNPQVIGVNNRDLARFATDLAITESLLPLVPASIVRVSESGIRSVSDVERVRAAGADAVLVGEALMRMPDPEPFLESVHALA